MSAESLNKQGRASTLLSKIIPTVLVGATIIWAFTGIDYKGFSKTAGNTINAIINGFLNPDWAYVENGSNEDLISLLLLTVAIGFVGTVISVVGAIPFAFMTARSAKKPRVVSGAGQVILSILRAFPEIVLAVIFVKMVGPGPFAGALAIGVHSIGMLGKMYAEEIEKLPKQPIEGIEAVGGNAVQIFRYAKLPLLIPQFLSLALNRFEISVRSATILGIVGAGGIGTPIIFAIASRSWDRVAIILIGIIVTVTIIDFVSSYLRKKLQ
ncbi:MAG: phosphonate ABC transporter, permease protein PhnE [Microbacteriaceae bacterium]|nr:phosphonate ABC transporter, permease protein PhnE [Microbacteriaceae bacterium]